MGSHLHAVDALIRLMCEAPDLRDVRILVSGRPFSLGGALWQRIGADGCAGDAEEAVRVGRKLLALD